MFIKSLKYFLISTLNSYAQIFFSLNKVLAVIILWVTFINPFLGACGLAAVIISNLLAGLLGLSKTAIAEGIYGFNALLLGLALGFEYQFNVAFLIVFLTALFLLLFNTVWLSTILGKNRLPFLGLPFLITYWLVYLAVGSFSFIQLQEQYIFTDNYVVMASQSYMYRFAHCLDNIALPDIFLSYFKTLSSTFFQSSVLAGILIAAGLLYFSRIVFTLSMLGYFAAYFFFTIVGINTALLTEYLVGSNFIFLSIAIGGFYLLPNKWSYLAVLILIPVLCIFLISLEKWMMVFQLKAFTLSFSLLVILFVFFVNNRWWQKFVQLVSIQYYSAEKTIYKHLSSTRRLKNTHLAKIILPFWGEWKVSQGYHGTITHLGDWGNALDFVIVDEQDKTYQLPGKECKDFYGYNKPVLAPFDGYVYDIISHIEDNAIGAVNIKENWGNTIILNHANGLFSQLSHLKQDSVKVTVGDYVTRGSILAQCGNSGRSPEPHLHFQLQLSPKLGEVTYPYPIAYFIKNESGKQSLCEYTIPQENDVVSNIEASLLLKTAYDFMPGMTMRLRNKSNESEVIEWKIRTDAWNRTFIFCEKTQSTVWFVNDGIMFYCYDFEGNTRSLLFDFYLANYKVLLASYHHLTIADAYPVHYFSNPVLLWIQDFVSPFGLFLKAKYQSNCNFIDNFSGSNDIHITATAFSYAFSWIVKNKAFDLYFKDNELVSFEINSAGKRKVYLCELSS